MINYSSLAVYSDAKFLNKNKLQIENQFGAFVFAAVDELPPFLIRLKLNTNIVSIKLVDQAETQTEIINFINTESVDYDDHRVTYFNGGAAGLAIDYGTYHLTFSDGLNNWISEDFKICADTDQMLKFVFSHNDDLCTSEMNIPAGHIGTIYINENEGKPNYSFEEKAKLRDGIKKTLEIVSWKTGRVAPLVPEFLADVLRLLPLYDNVDIFCGDNHFEVDEITTTFTWLTEGDLAEVLIEVRAADGVIVTPGRTDGSLQPPPGACFFTHYTAVGTTIEGTGPYQIGGIFINGQGRTLEVDEYVITRKGTSDPYWVLEQYAGGSSYNEILATTNQIIFDESGDRYWYVPGSDSRLKRLSISEVGTNFVIGFAVPFSIIEVYGVDKFGNESVIGVGTRDEFVNDGVTFLNVAGLVSVFVRASNNICGQYDISSLMDLLGFCGIVLSGEFGSDDLAIAGGLVAGDYYSISLDNEFGLPRGMIRQISPPANESFLNDGEAVQVIGFDTCYKVTGFDYGVQNGFVRMAAQITETYDSRIDATVNGIGTDEIFTLSSGNEEGISGGFLMLNY